MRFTGEIPSEFLSLSMPYEIRRHAHFSIPYTLAVLIPESSGYLDFSALLIFMDSENDFFAYFLMDAGFIPVMGGIRGKTFFHK